jgi:Xaa-Pro aminopeptidase
MSATPDFADHRRRLLERMADDEAVLLFGPPHHVRNSTTEYPYRADSDIWWLCGWEDPEVAVFLRPGDEPFTLFCQPKDKEREVWTGFRPGPEGARAHYGADAAFVYEDLEKELPRLLQGVSTLHLALGRDAEQDTLVRGAIARSERLSRKSLLSTPQSFHAPSKLLHELRLHKGADEIAVMREATRLTGLGHRAAMAATRPGVNERAIEALLNYEFRRGGGNGPGYNTIVAGGANACILHYIRNREALRDGDLLLVDAGCEYQNYTGDVTRTYPVNGRFSPAQRAVYEHVLDAQRLAIDAARAGMPYRTMHDRAVRRLTEGLVDLGLLRGSIDTLVAEEKYRKYYMHGTGHWLGIDVHDAGAYVVANASRPLAPGMIVTVEPGLYIPADDLDAPAELRGIGIRIEDDILVTAGDPENLTADIPKSVADIEAICG